MGRLSRNGKLERVRNAVLEDFRKNKKMIIGIDQSSRATSKAWEILKSATIDPSKPLEINAPPTIPIEVHRQLVTEIKNLIAPITAVTAVIDAQDERGFLSNVRKMHKRHAKMMHDPDIRAVFQLSLFAQRCLLGGYQAEDRDIEQKAPFPGARVMDIIRNHKDGSIPTQTIYTFDPKDVPGFQPRAGGTIFDYALSLAAEAVFLELEEAKKVRERFDKVKEKTVNELVTRLQDAKENDTIVSYVEGACATGTLTLEVLEETAKKLGENGDEIIKKHFRAILMDMQEDSIDVLKGRLEKSPYNEVVKAMVGNVVKPISKKALSNAGITDKNFIKHFFKNNSEKATLDMYIISGFADYINQPMVTDTEENRGKIQKGERADHKESPVYEPLLNRLEMMIRSGVTIIESSEKEKGILYDDLEATKSKKLLSVRLSKWADENLAAHSSIPGSRAKVLLPGIAYLIHVKEVHKMLAPGGYFLTTVFGAERSNRDKKIVNDIILSTDAENVSESLSNRIDNILGTISEGTKDLGANWRTIPRTVLGMRLLHLVGGFGRSTITSYRDKGLHILEATK